MPATDISTDSDTPYRDRAIHIDAQDARGGEIILRTKHRRAIFIGGLVAVVCLLAFA